MWHGRRKAPDVTDVSLYHDWKYFIFIFSRGGREATRWSWEGEAQVAASCLKSCADTVSLSLPIYLWNLCILIRKTPSLYQRANKLLSLSSPLSARESTSYENDACFFPPKYSWVKGHCSLKQVALQMKLFPILSKRGTTFLLSKKNNSNVHSDMGFRFIWAISAKPQLLLGYVKTLLAIKALWMEIASLRVSDPCSSSNSKNRTTGFATLQSLLYSNGKGLSRCGGTSSKTRASLMKLAFCLCGRLKSLQTPEGKSTRPSKGRRSGRVGRLLVWTACIP